VEGHDRDDLESVVADRLEDRIVVAPVELLVAGRLDHPPPHIDRHRIDPDALRLLEKALERLHLRGVANEERRHDRNRLHRRLARGSRIR
jgi:hypothetical protein